MAIDWKQVWNTDVKVILTVCTVMASVFTAWYSLQTRLALMDQSLDGIQNTSLVHLQSSTTQEAKDILQLKIDVATIRTTLTDAHLLTYSVYAN